MAASVALLALAPQAQAQAIESAQPDKQQVGLHFGGYDREAAAALGLAIKKNSFGLQYSVKQGATTEEDTDAQEKAAARQGKTVDNKSIDKVYNNYYDPSCGNAWLRVTPLGNASLKLETGFELNSGEEAWAYRWRVNLFDNGGASYKDWPQSGLNDQNEWQGNRTVTGLTRGPAWAQIASPWSYAVLGDASTCNAYPVTVSYTVL
ncbi:hypothetical protein [Kitasatospora sp. NBC_00070]|uniref:hypothetical protein n=1 Tax=Kitasatospora sp. NBC_00070 TaxID=2975962 RepID=UPI00386029D0